MFTVFANMRINSEERLKHLKDSFESFANASDDWLINIRGKKRSEAQAFLKEQLGERARFFELLDDARGWSKNALVMLPHAKHSYVLLWLEDHINVAGEHYLRSVVSEMEKQKVKCMPYSWYRVGWAKDMYEEQISHLDLAKGSFIESAEITPENWRRVVSYGHAPYLVSLVSIFDKGFLQRLLEEDQHIAPFPLTIFLYRALAVLRRLGLPLEQRKTFRTINRFLGHRLGRFSKETPFNLERGPERTDMLPLRVAFPLRELFASIDDDMDSPDHSYSLVSRGEYPLRDTLQPWNPQIEIDGYTQTHVTLPKGESVRERYAYYSDAKQRRASVMREYVAVLKGTVRITVKGRALELKKGEGVSLFTNIAHDISALEHSEIIRYQPHLGLAPYHFSA